MHSRLCFVNGFPFSFCYWPAWLRIIFLFPRNLACHLPASPLSQVCHSFRDSHPTESGWLLLVWWLSNSSKLKKRFSSASIFVQPDLYWKFIVKLPGRQFIRAHVSLPTCQQVWILLPGPRSFCQPLVWLLPPKTMVRWSEPTKIWKPPFVVTRPTALPCGSLSLLFADCLAPACFLPWLWMTSQITVCLWTQPPNLDFPWTFLMFCDPILSVTLSPCMTTYKSLFSSVYMKRTHSLWFIN